MPVITIEGPQMSKDKKRQLVEKLTYISNLFKLAGASQRLLLSFQEKVWRNIPCLLTKGK